MIPRHLRFEAAIRADYKEQDLDRLPNGSYRNTSTRHAWHIWQLCEEAFIAAMEQKLQEMK